MIGLKNKKIEKNKTKTKLKVNDRVLVISGKYKGKNGVIKRILKNNRIVIGDLTKLKKHVKPSEQHPDGGVIDIEGTINISNVVYMDPKSKGKKVITGKLGYSFEEGKKIRINRSTKKEVGK